MVAWNKGPFRGREALEAERARGVDRLLTGVEVEGRQPPRAGYAVSGRDGPLGEVSSGNFSPTLGRGIALAFLRPHVRPGDDVTVDARGQLLPGRIVAPPFVRKDKR